MNTKKRDKSDEKKRKKTTDESTSLEKAKEQERKWREEKKIDRPEREKKRTWPTLWVFYPLVERIQDAIERNANAAHKLHDLTIYLFFPLVSSCISNELKPKPSSKRRQARKENTTTD